MSMQRRLLVLLLIVVSVALLYPGVTQPVMTLTGTLEKSIVAELGIDMVAGEDADPQTRQMLSMFSSFLGFDQMEGQITAYQTTRSIWGTVNELATTGNLLVAFLIQSSFPETLLGRPMRLFCLTLFLRAKRCNTLLARVTQICVHGSSIIWLCKVWPARLTTSWLPRAHNRGWSF